MLVTTPKFFPIPVKTELSSVSSHSQNSFFCFIKAGWPLLNICILQCTKELKPQCIVALYPAVDGKQKLMLWRSRRCFRRAGLYSDVNAGTIVINLLEKLI
jgi:hypothetical protein